MPEIKFKSRAALLAEDNPNELKVYRTSLAEYLDALADRAADEKRNLTDDEKHEHRRVMTELRLVNELIRATEESRKRAGFDSSEIKGPLDDPSIGMDGGTESYLVRQ